MTSLLSRPQLTVAMLLPILTWSITTAQAQENFTCLTHEIHEQLLRDNPAYRKRFNQSEESIYQKTILQQKDAVHKSLNEDVYTIPVVVHIIHRSGISIGQQENLSNATVHNIIQAVNEDFAHASGHQFANANYGTNCNISFCLAQRDPQGNTTTGIIRHEDDNHAFYDLNDPNSAYYPLQNTYHWPTDQYYNIYVVQGISGSVAGFAFFPSSHGSAIDGAVVEYSTSPGVWTHELGHALNLHHTFQGGCSNNDCLLDGDKVCDTPPVNLNNRVAPWNCQNPSNSCSSDAHDNSSNNPYQSDQPDMVENYMDYTGCNLAFTEGQKTRMRLAVTTFRSSFLNSMACLPLSPVDASVTEVTFRDTCQGPPSIGVNATVQCSGQQALTSFDVELRVDNQLVTTLSWTGNLQYGESATIEIPFISATAGGHDVCVSVKHPNGTNHNPSFGEQCRQHAVDQYCPMNSYFYSNHYIDSLSIHNMTSKTGPSPDGRGYHIDRVIEASRGERINWHCFPFYFNNSNYTKYTDIWIDYNQDYDFDDAGEYLGSFSSIGFEPIAGSFDIPINAPLGTTRLRIAYGANSCASATCAKYGEYEDYSLRINPINTTHNVKLVDYEYQDSCGALMANGVITIQNSGSATLQSARINYTLEGSHTNTILWNGNLASGASETLTLPALTVPQRDKYDLCVSVSLPNNQQDERPNDNQLCEEGRLVDAYCPLTFDYDLDLRNYNYLTEVKMNAQTYQTAEEPSNYGDYTHFTFNFHQFDRVEYKLSLGSSGDPFMSGSRYCNVWIDFNQDYDFDDPGEQVVNNRIVMPTLQTTGDFDIPDYALQGETRMRVGYSLFYTLPSGGVGTSLYGEVEEYTVHIAPPKNQNDIALKNFDYVTDCGYEEVKLSTEVVIQNVGAEQLSSTSLAIQVNGDTYQQINWNGALLTGQKDTVLISDLWIPAGQNNICIAAYQPNGVKDNNTTNNTLCHATAYMDNYCPLEFTNDLSSFYWLDSVAIGDINHKSGAEENQYGNYSHLMAYAEPGDEIAYTLRANPFNNLRWHHVIWIDYNKDYDFDDPGEKVVDIRSSISNQVDGHFTIPTGAEIGKTRMRVGFFYNTPPLGGVGTATYGEIEDYSLVLTDCDTLITFPYKESFEKGVGIWKQDLTDDFDWNRYNSVQLNSTEAPANASEGGFFLHANTDNQQQYNRYSATSSECFDIGNADDKELVFDYHLSQTYGNKLFVLVSSDGGGHWERHTFDHYDPNNGWSKGRLNLSAYQNQVIQIRFMASTHESKSASVSIDNIELKNKVNCQQNMEVNYAPIPTDTYAAQQTVRSAGEIKANEQVNFEANTEVELGAGFTVEAGAEFTIKMGGACP